jgi:hypothetical protein
VQTELQAGQGLQFPHCESWNVSLENCSVCRLVVLPKQLHETIQLARAGKAAGGLEIREIQ